MKAILHAVLTTIFCRPLSVDQDHLVGKYGRTQRKPCRFYPHYSIVRRDVGSLKVTDPPLLARTLGVLILMSKEPKT